MKGKLSDRKSRDPSIATAFHPKSRIICGRDEALAKMNRGG
jgi:hypothetical protein